MNSKKQILVILVCLFVYAPVIAQEPQPAASSKDASSQGTAKEKPGVGPPLFRVNHDSTLKGDGTTASPLGVANGGVTGSKIAAGQVVKSLNGLADNVTLSPGANITITPFGNSLSIAAPNVLGSVARDNTLVGNGTVAAPLGLAVPLSLSGSSNLSSILNIVNSGTGPGISAAGNSLGLSAIGSDSADSPGGFGVFGGGGNSTNENGGGGVFALGGASVKKFGGIGVFAVGGNSIDDFPGSGVRAIGGASPNRAGGFGVDAVGGASPNGFGGPGVQAVGGESIEGFGGLGVNATGGRVVNFAGGGGIRANGGGSTNGSGGVGVTANGGASTNGRGGNGISAFAGRGPAGDGLAGDFIGDVVVSGTLSKLAGSFKIDHPLDPANKYLSHSFVESPDMMNVYNGNITTGRNGEAIVTLPDYFEALNRDFRYQLTVIGQFAQAIVASEVRGNSFTIKTDRPGVKVSWQVTGIRQDAYANKHRIPVEEMKPERERGYYLHPQVFNQPEDKSLQWTRHPEMMREVKSRRDVAEMQRREKENDRR